MPLPVSAWMFELIQLSTQFASVLVVSSFAWLALLELGREW